MNHTPHVEFVSYTGAFPELCMGLLTLKINGKVITFGNGLHHPDFPKFWYTGGFVDIQRNPYKREWHIDIKKLPEIYKKYAREIDTVFNANVPHGCCGGCY